MSSGSLSAATRETGGGGAFRPGPRTAFAMGSCGDRGCCDAGGCAAIRRRASAPNAGAGPQIRGSAVVAAQDLERHAEAGGRTRQLADPAGGAGLHRARRAPAVSQTLRPPDPRSRVGSRPQNRPGSCLTTTRPRHVHRDADRCHGHGPDNGRVVHDPHQRWQDRPPEGHPRGRQTRSGRAACGAAREPRRPCSCQRGLGLDPLGTARTQSARRLDLSGRAGLSI